MKGSRITVNVHRVTSTVCPSAREQIECCVVEEYPKYIVLDTGKFRFCAFRDDLSRGEVITI